MTSPGRIVLGAALIGAGILFLLDSQDVLEAGEAISRWWPALLILLGVLQYATDRQSVAASALLVGIGVVLLGVRLELLGSDAWSVFWPLAVIGAGLWVLLGRRRTVTRAGSDSVVTAFAVLSGRKVVVSSDHFERADITAVLGGLEVDLTGATPAPGAELSVTVLLGGCDVIIPEGWRATITGTPILGGWDDTTRRDMAAADAPHVTISGLAILGGIEVRHPKRWGT